MKLFKSFRNTKFIIKKMAIFSALFIILFLIDWLLKYFFFEPGASGQGTFRVQHDWKIIAIRSLLHESTTFFDYIGIKIPRIGGLVISGVIAFGFFVALFMSKKIFTTIGLAILLAGLFGNTLDNIFHNGVRDILFLPWFDRGTFNLADVLVVVGAGTTLLAILIGAFRNTKHE